MKNLFLFLIAFSLMFTSCDGEDHENGSDDNCYFIIAPVANNNENVCSISFFFIDDQGNEYDFQNNPNHPTYISLPKNRCYDAWAIERGIKGEECGEFRFTIENEEGDLCFSFTKYLDGRPDIIPTEFPQFSFCLDDECNFPEITQNY